MITPRSISAEQGAALVQSVIKTWTTLYEPLIQFSSRGEDDSLRYTAIFSMPDKECPVPVSVLQTDFCVRRSKDGRPTIDAQFEKGDFKHQFSLEVKDGRLVPSGAKSLGKGKFDKYISRLIREKTMVRDYQDLGTSFEQCRLIPPESLEESDSESDSDASSVSETTRNAISAYAKAKTVVADTAPQPFLSTKRRQSLGAQYAEMSRERLSTIVTEDDKKIAAALRNAGLPCYEKLSFAQLLFNMFDAADENDEGYLRHNEILSLLIKTFANHHLGLRPWDMRKLASIVHENEEGKIPYKIFVQEAPEIIESLRVRRLQFESYYPDRATWDSDLMMQGEGPTWEAVNMLYGDELRKSCEIVEAHNVDNVKGGYMPRNEFETLLYSRPERFSPQETSMLMQFMPQTEEGNLVPYVKFYDIYAQLRSFQLYNSLVENDTDNLRKHLIILLRRNGLTETEVLPLRVLKEVLLLADQVNLSRMQIHVLLCLQLPNFDGICSVDDFLTICCSVISRFFDPDLFLATADAVKEQMAAAQRKLEQQEINALTGQAEDGAGGMGQAEDAAVTDNRVELEKALIALCASLDEHHRGVLPITTMLKALSSDWDRDIEGGLSRAESVGFAAEMCPDEENMEVAYVDHVRTWMPIILELRKSNMFQELLKPDPFRTEGKSEGIPLVDLYPYSLVFPIFPPEMFSIGGAAGRRSISGQLRVPGSQKPHIQSASKSGIRRSSHGRLPLVGDDGSSSIAMRRSSASRLLSRRPSNIQTRKSMLSRTVTIGESRRPSIGAEQGCESMGISMMRRPTDSKCAVRGVERRRINQAKQAEQAAEEACMSPKEKKSRA